MSEIAPETYGLDAPNAAQLAAQFAEFIHDPNSQCSSCVHKHRDDEGCTAFPLEIPDEIYFNVHDHRFPYAGDDGVTFDQDLEASVPELHRGSPTPEQREMLAEGRAGA